MTWEQIAKEKQNGFDARIVLVKHNGKLQELTKPAQDGEVSFLTLKDKDGQECYRRSLVLLMLKAVYNVGGSDKADRVRVQYSVGEGYYCTMDEMDHVDQEFLDQVMKEMHDLADRDLPINKQSMHTDDAIALFNKLGMQDKERLFRFRRASRVNVYELDGFYDYFYGYMVPSTGYLTQFALIAYDEGFVLHMPDRKNPDQLPEFKPHNKVASVLKESTRWGELMGITTVADLNSCIVQGKASELILMQEALWEKKLADIVNAIVQDRDKRLIMIAGPSSSGKTTFSHRLSVQLAANGLIPHPIPMDNYYLDRDKTPRDADGNYDFECLEALDIELFNQNMTDLLAGREVAMPTYNFKTGKREYKGDTLKLKDKDVLVIEGIHGLNDKLSYSLPKESKFKIYISALTQLNIDEHNRIPTTDGRLLRRIVRDARTRNTAAKETIAMWASVRRGEESYIFPNQEMADVMINSAMIYELAVLKIYAEPLLFGISPSDPEYTEAKRLLKFLDYFIGIPSESIPINSVLREFVGGSCFPVG